jgi:hypothetical protein
MYHFGARGTRRAGIAAVGERTDARCLDSQLLVCLSVQLPQYGSHKAHQRVVYPGVWSCLQLAWDLDCSPFGIGDKMMMVDFMVAHHG